MATCYMCASPSTSREHAPPRCFFPELKDVGIDLRKDLISVPSCETHNAATSQDDEYAMVLIVSHFENNQTAGTQFATKVVRALERSPAFVAKTFNTNTPVTVDGRPSLAFKVDDARFERVMDKTIRALYFDQMGSKLERALRIQSASMKKLDAVADAELAFLSRLGAHLFAQAAKRGSNPEVFYYQLADDQAAARGVMRLCFYGGFEVFGTWSPDIT